MHVLHCENIIHIPTLFYYFAIPTPFFFISNVFSTCYLSSLLNVTDFFLLQKMKVVLLVLVLSFASMAYCQDAVCLAGRLSNSDVSNCATELAVSLLQSTKTIDILMVLQPSPHFHAIVLPHYKH